MRPWTSSFLLSLILSIPLSSLPTNEKTIQGQCLIEKSPHDLTIGVSDRAILEWETFSIQSGEKVTFQFDAPVGAVLNRVVGSELSEIHGQLSSNGNVYLTNPHGILIGKEGLIHTGSFLASTLSCSNDDFINQSRLHFKGSHGGMIHNEGTIRSSSNITLISEEILNTGSIQTSQGKITLNAARELIYSPNDQATIQIVLQPSIGKNLEVSGISQSGEIFGIDIDLLADGNLYGYAIRNEGVIEAVRVDQTGGQIRLIAEDGVTHHSGLIKGNEIQLLGQHIRIVEEAEIDASRPEGGGRILIGGDYQGSNPSILNANTTLVEKGAFIRANSLDQGDGGTIIIWADGLTGCHGNIEVLGGPNGGNGGFVEASGKCSLDFAGLVNARAPLGKEGTLLLDPANITISGGGDTNIAFTACPTGTYNVTANTAVINAANLVTNLGTCSVTISTAAAGTQTGTITISSPINWLTNSSLTMNANSSIAINANVTNTSNSASLTFNCGTTLASVLTVAAGVTVSLTGSGVAPTGTLTLASNAILDSDMTISGAVSATDKALTLLVNDDFTLTAGTGSIVFNSPGKLFTWNTTGSLTTNVANFNGSVTITEGNASLINNTGSISITAPIVNNGTGTLLISAGTTLTTNATGTITTAATASHLTLNAGTTATFGGVITHNAANANFSVTGGTSALFNANTTARPAGSTGTTSVNAGTIAAGNITIGAGTTFTHSSLDPITLLATTVAGSDILINGILAVSNADLTLSAIDDFTLAAAPAAINYDAIGKTFNFSTTSAAGSISTFGGPVTITQGNVNFSSAGSGSIAINAPLINNGTGSILIAAGGALTSSAAGTITTALGSGNLTLNSGTTATLTGAITHNAVNANFSSTCGTSAIFNGNVLARPTGSTGTTTIVGSTTATGSITIGAGTTFTHNSPDNIDFTATGIAASDIIINGILNVSNANLTLTAIDDLTLAAAPAAINYDAIGKTFMIDLTSLAGSAATFGGPVIVTNGIVDWMTAGGTISINNQFTINGTGTVTLSAVGTITAGPASIITHNSPGDLNFTALGAGSDININGQFTIPNSNATFFPSDDFTLGSTGSMIFSSPLPRTLTFLTGPTTSHSFNGPLTVNGGNLMVDAFDDIAIAAVTGSVTFNSPGGTATFTSSGGVDPDFSLSGTLNITDGTLSISTVDDIVFNAGSTFIHSSPNTITFSAIDAIVMNGASTISNGAFNMNAMNNNISFGAGSLINYTSSLPWQMAAPNGSISINGNILINSPADWNIIAGTDFFINALATNSSTGNFIASCGGSCNIGFSTNTTASRFGTAGGSTQLTTGSNLFIVSSETNALGTAFLGFSSGGQTGPITLSVAGAALIDANRNQDAGIESPGTLNMTVGSALAITTDPIPGQTGRAYIQCSREAMITADDIQLTGFTGGAQAFIEGLTLPISIVANKNVDLAENSFMRNTGPSKLVVVVDQQVPLPPGMGNGRFSLETTAFLSTNGGELSIYTADPSLNNVDGLINGATLAQGNQVYGVYYSLSGEDPPPFTIFYKTGFQGTSTEIPIKQLNEANIAISEMIQQTFDRQMGFTWYTDFWLLNRLDSSFKTKAPFYRKAFEYSLLINNSRLR